jgi:hypothetical protein
MVRRSPQSKELGLDPEKRARRHPDEPSLECNTAPPRDVVGGRRVEIEGEEPPRPRARTEVLEDVDIIARERSERGEPERRGGQRCAEDRPRPREASFKLVS